MTTAPEDAAAGKAVLRGQIRDRRRARDLRERNLAATALADRVIERLGLVSEVCCYLSMDTEPGTDPLIARLVKSGVRVHVPRVEGAGLRWIEFAPGDALIDSALGIREPAATSSHALPGGVDAIIMPALAATGSGARLGQGGGYYDRALASVAVHAGGGPLRIALVFDDEIRTTLPLEEHDLRVDVVISPVRTIEP